MSEDLSDSDDACRACGSECNGGAECPGKKLPAIDNVCRRCRGTGWEEGGRFVCALCPGARK